MSRDARIDAYIAKAGPFARPILEHLRELVHGTIAGLDEDMKWGMPHYVLNGKNLAGMAAFKAHCTFMIHGDGRQGDAMGQFGKITQLSDLPPEADLKAKLLAAAGRIESAGTALKPRTAPRPAKAEIAMPDDFAAALAAAPRAIFDGFSPSQQREYLEWIVEAKRPETRAKRIAQAAEWIGEGKKRNWKYEGC
ncbi:MAG: YdeI/OmpD-associated family protein [Sphingomonadales bacterium]|nr:YdeI/OmpD-associated family protein [Sphingomonadales bacterium]